MKKKEYILTKTSQEAIAAFDEAARDWGWQSDQGVYGAVDRSKECYERCRKELIKRMLCLEIRIAKQKEAIRDLTFGTEEELRNLRSI